MPILLHIANLQLAALDAEKLSGAIPLGWFGDPGDVAHAALFLAENCYANNCHLTIDGGLSAGGF